MKANDTSLIRMVIRDLATKHNWDYNFTLDQFYNSRVCKGLSDERTGIFTYAPREIIELFDQDCNVNKRM